MKNLDRQNSLEQAYQYECKRSEQWKRLAGFLEHDLNVVRIERDEARLAIKVVVLGIVACMLGLMFIMVHYGTHI